jgi:Uma2 family endonuclease
MALETKLVTAEELFRMPDQGRSELVEGELRTMTPASAQHGRIASRLAVSLGAYIDQHDLGVTLAAETGFIIRRNPDTVRAPDVAFVRQERWNSPEGYFPGPPDLAIEVISPNDRYSEVKSKVADWLQAGTPLAIVVDPEQQSAEMFTSTSTVSVDIDGSLDGGAVVPGWTLPLRDLFVS